MPKSTSPNPPPKTLNPKPQSSNPTPQTPSQMDGVRNLLGLSERLPRADSALFPPTGSPASTSVPAVAMEKAPIPFGHHPRRHIQLNLDVLAAAALSLDSSNSLLMNEWECPVKTWVVGPRPNSESSLPLRFNTPNCRSSKTGWAYQHWDMCQTFIRDTTTHATHIAMSIVTAYSTNSPSHSLLGTRNFVQDC